MKPVHLLALALAACGGDAEAPSSGRVAAPPAGRQDRRPSDTKRAPDAAERTAMLDVLETDTSAERKIWFVVSPGIQETNALALALEAVFRDAGWEANTQTLTGMVLKPGVPRILVAEEQEPPEVDVVRRALEAGGLACETGTGYREYYEERKREDPGWPGLPIAAEQPFVVAVPPEPPGA